VIVTTHHVHCDATHRSHLCLGRIAAGADNPSEAAELARLAGWTRLAPDGPNEPVTHLCPVCATGPR
jgi:hypothetical protein